VRTSAATTSPPPDSAPAPIRQSTPAAAATEARPPRSVQPTPLDPPPKTGEDTPSPACVVVDRPRKRAAALRAKAALESQIVEQCEYAQAQMRVCSAEFCGSERCRNDISYYREFSVIESERRTEEKEEGKMGQGLCAKQPITKGDLLGSYYQYETSKRNKEKKLKKFVVKVSKEQNVAATSRAVFINHRCTSFNCRMEKVSWLKNGKSQEIAAIFACEDISTGDFLSIRYNPSDDGVREFFLVRNETCECGQEGCVSGNKLG
jgi:hypothetical protein